MLAVALWAGPSLSYDEYVVGEHIRFFDENGVVVGEYSKNCQLEIEYWGELWTGYDEYTQDFSCPPIVQDPACTLGYQWETFSYQPRPGVTVIKNRGIPTCLP